MLDPMESAAGQSRILQWEPRLTQPPMREALWSCEQCTACASDACMTPWSLQNAATHTATGATADLTSDAASFGVV